jgi:arylsulfatase A-like enzyme
LPFATSFLAGSAVVNSSAAENRPNILFAFADDWGFLASAYAGNVDGKPGELQKLVSTPNFDRVAENGVLFTHAYVSAPSCTPCRSALLTGQHFFRTGSASVLLGVWDPALPSFPLLLRDQAGYHIGQTCKVWAPGRPEDAPYGGKQHEYERRGTYSSFPSGSPIWSKKREKASKKREKASKKPSNPCTTKPLATSKTSWPTVNPASPSATGGYRSTPIAPGNRAPAKNSGASTPTT